ncbi:MAG TPA: solute carrier family 23 protein [Oscillospiraceae bacterium]|nr:solute carrier family 23 protein [Oscillospiraceae bacterium]HPF56760.1 solute carrier family 23 protein [Clostridiales bacterium]HPK34244.1 solute carrier family 23 protein [Oscillospiraceae bacterium]HPR74853.1 solute carrier family 23 protein [Oscillospiraceae bacterium]
MKLIYDVKDKPKFGQLLLFALQQLLAIMAATLVVPIIVNNSGATNLEMDPAAALLGAGVGTLIYLLFTKGRSPVFLGSSFAFMTAMFSATAFGYFGIIAGAILAGLVYVIIAAIIKIVGTKWVSKLMPPVVIGPTVALIGLSLAGSAVGNLTKASATGQTYNLIAILCGLITLAVTVVCATYGKKLSKLIPFIIGILAGYAAASVFTVIGNATGVEYLKIINFSALQTNFAPVTFESFIHVPKFAFVQAITEAPNFDWANMGTIALLYMPVAFVVFAEHIADHKNLSSIIERDLLEDPGLSRTLMGDGVGSMVGAFFGSCPNTTYGESIGCVAITRNASVYSILYAAAGAIILSFLSPFVAFINTIPDCVMGGVCIALYGFIAVSGLRMFKEVDLNKNRNLFVVSVILITGVGGLALNFGKITITEIAAALILGILTNVLLSGKSAQEE